MRHVLAMTGPDRQPLLPEAGKFVSPKKLDFATEAVTTRVERIKAAVQSRRDAPSTLIGCAVCFGVLSGLVAYVYSAYFETMLWVMWEVGCPCVWRFHMSCPFDQV